MSGGRDGDTHTRSSAVRKSARESAKKMTQKRHPRSLVGAGGSFAVAGPFSAWSCREGSESEDGGDMAAGGKHERRGRSFPGEDSEARESKYGAQGSRAMRADQCPSSVRIKDSDFRVRVCDCMRSVIALVLL